MRRAARALRAALAGTCFVALGLGCNAILGNEKGEVVAQGDDAASSDGTVTTTDGHVDVDATSNDSATFDAGCTADVAVDPANCGRCGHDCAGAACELGACKPQTMVSDAGVLRDLAADETRVFWTTPVVVGTMFTDGGAPHVFYSKLDDEGGAPARVTLTPIEVAWSEVPPVYSQPFRVCPKEGCADGAVPLNGDKLGAIAAIGANDGAIYWTELGGSRLRAAPLDGGASNDVVASGVRGFAVTPDLLYWVGDGVDGGGAVLRGALDGTSVTDLLDTDAGGMSAVALDRDGSIFFADTAGISRRSPDGGVDLVTSDVSFVLAILPVGEAVYWIDASSAFAGAGQLRRCSVAKCTTPELVWPTVVVGAARTSRFIFFADRAGTVGRVAF